MHWIVRNSPHLIVPLAMTMSLLGILVSLATKYNRRNSGSAPVVTRPMAVGLIVVICAGWIMFGILVGHAFS